MGRVPLRSTEDKRHRPARRVQPARQRQARTGRWPARRAFAAGAQGSWLPSVIAAMWRPPQSPRAFVSPGNLASGVSPAPFCNFSSNFSSKTGRSGIRFAGMGSDTGGSAATPKGDDLALVVSSLAEQRVPCLFWAYSTRFHGGGFGWPAALPPGAVPCARQHPRRHGRAAGRSTPAQTRRYRAGSTCRVARSGCRGCPAPRSGHDP